MGIIPCKCLLGRLGMNILQECSTLTSASGMYMYCFSSPAISKNVALIQQLNLRKGFKNTYARPC